LVAELAQKVRFIENEECADESNGKHSGYAEQRSPSKCSVARRGKYHAQVKAKPFMD
jgi:hypothetical protein